MGLTVAAGIAQGAQAFLTSFLQVSQMKNQEKLKKNSHIEQILLSQIADPNTNYYQRAKMLDAIGTMYKTEQPLSHILGYDKLNEEDFKIEDSQIQVLPSKQTTMQNPIAGSDETIETQEATNELRLTTPAKFAKRGSLSPNQINTKHRLDLQKADNEADVKKAESLAKLQFDLQEKSYKANGYKITSEGTNANGEYIQVLTNNSGDTKINKLPPGFKPLKLSLAEKKGAPGRLGQLLKTHQIISDFESGDSNVSKTDYEAAKQNLEIFQRTGKWQDAQIEALGEKAAGTGPPISPAQREDDRRANQDVQIKLQSAYDEAESKAVEASDLAASTAEAATRYWETVVEPHKAAMTANGDPESQEYKTMQAQLNGFQREFNRLTSAADRANAKDQGLKKKVLEAKERLNNFSSGNISVTKYKPFIEAFRNANLEKTKNLSDDQILDILRQKYGDRFK